MNFTIFALLILPLILVIWFIFTNNKRLIYFYEFSNWIPLYFPAPYISRINISEIIYIYMFLYSLFAFKVIKNKLKSDSIFKIMLLFFVLFLTHFIIGRNNDTTRSFIYNFLLIFQYTFFLIIFIKQKLSVYMIIKYYYISYLIILSVGIISFFMPGIFPNLRDIWYHDYGGTALRYDILQTASIPLLYSLIYSKINVKIITVSIYLTLIILSGGRTQLIISLIWIVYYQLYTIGRKGKLSKYFSFVSLILIICAVFISVKYLRENTGISSYFTRYRDVLLDIDKSFGARFNYWDLAINKIMENPITGNVINSNKEMVNLGYDLVERSVLSGRSHNNYIAVTYAYGLIGLIIYIVLIITIIKTILSVKVILDKKEYMFLIFIVMGNIVAGFTVGNYFNFVCSPIILALISYSRMLKTV